jgi:hypothetical protein
MLTRKEDETFSSFDSFWIIGRNGSLLLWNSYMKISFSYNSNQFLKNLSSTLGGGTLVISMEW